MSFEKVLLILFVSALLLGPDHLPKYASWLATAVKKVKALGNDAKQRLDDEMGEDAVDWKNLDPRQYDPRRIIREALVDDGLPPVHQVGNTETAVKAAVAKVTFEPHISGTVPPFDSEAT